MATVLETSMAFLNIKNVPIVDDGEKLNPTEKVETKPVPRIKPPEIRVRHPSEYFDSEVVSISRKESQDVETPVLLLEEVDISKKSEEVTGKLSRIVSGLSLESEEEKAIRVLRESTIETLKLKLQERQRIRRSNVFLQKKLVEHFKRRRMDHVLQEDTQGLDQESKYLKRLYAFKDFQKTQEQEIVNIDINITELRKKTEELELAVKEAFDKLIEREKLISEPLIMTKSGKKINEKVVERLINKQVSNNEDIRKKRLKFIKIKNLIEEKQEQLRGLEHIGEGLHMRDFEQMKIENQNLNNKLEEREDEIIKVQLKTKASIQSLSQVREKCFAIDSHVEHMETRTSKVDRNVFEAKTRIKIAKKKRDEYIAEFLRLKQNSGLLNRERLLRDFELSINEADDVAAELAALQKEFAKRKGKLERVTKTIQRRTSCINFVSPIESSKKHDYPKWRTAGPTRTA